MPFCCICNPHFTAPLSSCNFQFDKQVGIIAIAFFPVFWSSTHCLPYFLPCMYRGWRGAKQVKWKDWAKLSSWDEDEIDLDESVVLALHLVQFSLMYTSIVTTFAFVLFLRPVFHSRGERKQKFGWTAAMVCSSTQLWVLVSFHGWLVRQLVSWDPKIPPQICNNGSRERESPHHLTLISGLWLDHPIHPIFNFPSCQPCHDHHYNFDVRFRPRLSFHSFIEVFPLLCVYIFSTSKLNTFHIIIASLSSMFNVHAQQHIKLVYNLYLCCCKNQTTNICSPGLQKKTNFPFQKVEKKKPTIVFAPLFDSKITFNLKVCNKIKKGFQTPDAISNSFLSFYITNLWSHFNCHFTSKINSPIDSLIHEVVWRQCQ